VTLYLLSAVALFDVPDVRPVIASYEGAENIGTKYMQVEAEHKANLIQSWKEEQARKQAKNQATSWFSSLLGTSVGIVYSSRLS
jgi:hypothetical protein